MPTPMVKIMGVNIWPIKFPNMESNHGLKDQSLAY